MGVCIVFFCEIRYVIQKTANRVNSSSYSIFYFIRKLHIVIE